ncbi:hypothetical protein K432DRAFT_419133 [Lepidopterella palustris CBS 459.81]|uniref:Uncharacterized protein n=1 Tax=Lepidopterella palustris CBS 459.81 TaxID=1314670 RepID=A0A8E2JBR1_9PEZI|nr:hypothetical protein K432DRAFT_419133 [Lepidopterella palustris CBS 459.81]
MGFLGVPTLLNSYMPVPSEPNSDLAAKKLRVDRMAIPEYPMLDDNSVRFQSPTLFSGPERLVLLRSVYVGVSPPNNPPSIQGFHCHNHLYYPDKVLLLESFIRTILEDSLGLWRTMLMVEDTALDSCNEESVRSWFNERIRQRNSGLHRITAIKRAGKGQPLTK